MNHTRIFEKFKEKSPVSVMSGASVERFFSPERLDGWFEEISDAQYTRELLFSSVFDIMSLVVCGIRPSVHAAYQACEDEIGVTITSVYNKLNGMETGTSAGLVRRAAEDASAVIRELGGAREPLLPGYRVKLLDGNCIKATDHRLGELRDLGSGALPGKSLVVLDPELRIPIDVFPCEDGHAQERSLLGDVVKTVSPGDVWVGDRNFCTRGFLTGIAERDGFFVIREHAGFPWEPLGKEKKIGRTETGVVYEQPVRVVGKDGKEWKFRRIRVVLKKETRDGDTEIGLFTNLSKRSVNARVIAELYRRRWGIETAFQDLAVHLNSEINTLGYPRAALFGFCVALTAYMITAVIKAAISGVHGSETADKKISGYYLSDEISGTYRGMMIAVSEEDWFQYRTCGPAEFAEMLKELASKIKLSAFRKHPRGPKKPPKKRKYDPKKPHVSTARLIAARKTKGSP